MFELRSSPIHGHGVFALRRIRKGTRLIEYVGERITSEAADLRYDDDAMDRPHTFLFTVDVRTVIDAAVGGNEARFINHSCNPNCEAVDDGGRIFIEALRNIRPGEELTYDYRLERNGRWRKEWAARYACHCGAPNCRGTLLVKPKRPTMLA
jgi:SET domain-containing protein